VVAVGVWDMLLGIDRKRLGEGGWRREWLY